MNSKFYKWIVIVLALLLVSPHLCAQVTEETGTIEIGNGTADNPFIIPVVDGRISYTKTGIYCEGQSSTLSLYYKLVLLETTQVSIVTVGQSHFFIIKNSEDEIIDSQLVLGGKRIEDLVLQPGIFYFIQFTTGENITMTLSVEGERVVDEPYHPEAPDNYTPTQEMNYVRTITPTTVVSDANSLYLLSRNKHQIRYYDQLGRFVQEVAYRASADWRDIITASQTYDALGRDDRRWLPLERAAGQSAGSFLSPGDVSSQAAVLYDDGAAFSRPVYEESPLNRIVEQYGPGSEWQENGRSQKSSYRTNTVADGCLHLVASGSAEAPVLTTQGSYPAGALEVTERTDEDGHTVLSFTDPEGRLVLSRALNGTEQLDTYHVYDDLGNLCFVLPPLAADGVGGTQQATLLEKYAYQYRYDYRRRCIGKKMPGCGWTEMIYDRANRLVLTKDGRGECIFTLCDPLGREVLQGTYRGTWPSRSTCDTADIYARFTPGVAGAVEGYTVTGPLNASDLQVLKANYYDNYTFASSLSGFGSSLSYAADARYGQRYTGNAAVHCKDLLTGSMTACLNGGQKLYAAYYYDYDRRLVQERHTMLNGATRVVKTAYNFSDQPVRTEETLGTAATLRKGYAYDHVGRLTREVHSWGTDSVQLLYGYDLRDRLVSKVHVHGTDSMDIQLQYNIRSWLEEISSPKFKQNLHYNTGSGTPYYNGNISSMTWQAGSETAQRGYKFAYDGLNRLTSSTYGEGASIGTNPNRFTEKVTGYDKQGNIKGLQRYGQTAASAYGLIDNLTLTYDGNRLTRADDAVTASAYNSGFEFKDGVKQANEYTYDANGNLTKDLNKNISSIQYNCLNLPSLVTFGDGSTITYTYAADGTKLRTVHQISGTTTTTDYCGSVIYENGVAKRLLTNAGYITLADNRYHYYLQDHQGNNRVVLNQSGAVEELNHYYPFGGVFASTGNVQPYKYNGKEYDSKKGLNWYDYGARHYDAALGRWMVVDPMAEGYYGITPYAYCLNNPVKLVDKDGEFPSLIPALVGGGIDYAAQVTVNRISGMSWKESFTNVNLKSVAISAVTSMAGVGLANVTKKALAASEIAKASAGAGKTLEVIGNVAVDATVNVAQQILKGKAIDAEELVMDVTINQGISGVGAAIKLGYQNSARGQQLHRDARHLENTASKKKRTPRAIEAEKARTKADEYGQEEASFFENFATYIKETVNKWLEWNNKE